MNHQASILCQVAPALRGLLAESSILPLVTFEDETPQVDVTVTLSDDPIVPQLKDALASADGPVTRVCVEGLGTFAAKAIDASYEGRVAGKVAVVTGAAQGFGLEIAQDLASEGAVVVLADINVAAASAEAKKLEAQYGQGRAVAVSMNVTDAESIAQALKDIVKAYGGLDLFVSNAGVLKAESVKTQSLADFKFVTDVNYIGFFQCVQQVSPILAAQRAGRADYTSDIIQINSKSGLVGSNRNGAYAGSKFGGVGLVQSFAMELVEDGTKVNAICPGNFFDGPLWSNPDNGLFVQYLRTGKVPGAKTLEDVKKFYESKVLMKRGCTTSDVMKAVYYLMEQQYETGQAVPVTGGQVMLH
jgi:sorbitol-6-phosphate 2-dehydrogenase